MNNLREKVLNQQTKASAQTHRPSKQSSVLLICPHRQAATHHWDKHGQESESQQTVCSTIPSLIISAWISPHVSTDIKHIEAQTLNIHHWPFSFIDRPNSPVGFDGVYEGGMGIYQW